MGNWTDRDKSEAELLLDVLAETGVITPEQHEQAVRLIRERIVVAWGA